jgi:esterase
MASFSTGIVRGLLVGAAILLGACQTAPQPSWELPPGVKTLTVNGYPMAYVELGAGPTLVLVHGAQNDYRYWALQMEPLATHFRVVAVSLRHYYPERWNGKGDDFSTELHAKDLATFIDRLGSGPVYLVGHSRGGAVATEAALERPELVRKLVLAEPAILSLVPSPASAPGVDPRVARQKALADRFSSGDIDGALELFTDQINGPGAWKKRSEESRQFARDNAWTLTRQTSDIESIGCAGFAGLKMPVLLVRSDKGPRLLAAILDSAQTCLPRAYAATIGNSGHQMNRDNPVDFDRALVEFLDRN